MTNKSTNRVLEILKENINIIERSPVVTFLWENQENWPVEFVSKNVTKIFGYTAEEFLSKKIVYSEIIHPNDLQKVVEEVSINSNYNSKSFSHEPYRIISKTGEIKWIKDETYIRRDENGNINYYEGIVIDITKQIEAKNKLKVQNKELLNAIEKAEKNETLYKLLSINTLDTIWTTDIDFNLTYVNNAIYDFLGYKPEELLSLHPSTFTTTEGMSKLTDMAKQLTDKYKAGKIIQHKSELQQIKKDGSVIDVEIRANLLLNKIGEIIGFQGRSIDITERKQTEQALKESEKKLQKYKKRIVQTLKGTDSGTFIYDIPNEVIILDKIGKNLLGLNKSKLLFDEWEAIVLAGDKNRINAQFSEGFKNQEKTINITFRIKTSDQTIGYIQVNSIVKYFKTKPFKVYGIILNITQQKKIEEELVIAKQKLNEELARSKRDLVSTAIELSTTSEVIINSLKTINKILEKHSAKKICEDLLNVKKELEYQLKKQDIWELFKIRFQQVHPKFFIKLGTKYPSLSKSELKFCAYLRVDLSSYQIAAALNISKEGIRKARYRIRKKIGLDPKKSLEQYISKF
ncbi:MAG: PAS domain S-box protein [Bacteroidales bacterium]|nr:PAS domain S-box protein [Bacteroidales bacterium]